MVVGLQIYGSELVVGLHMVVGLQISLGVNMVVGLQILE